MMQSGQHRIRLRIDGRVQGVGFRWFVVTEAERLGLAGWVRNNPDGSVELRLKDAKSHWRSYGNGFGSDRLRRA